MVVLIQRRDLYQAVVAIPFKVIDVAMAIQAPIGP